MEKLRSLGKVVGNWALGFIALTAIIGIMGVCQVVRDEIRPFIPQPLKSLFLGGEATFIVDEYLASVPRAFEMFDDEATKCREIKDQHCLTEAIRRFMNDIGPAVPAEASWMSDSHGRLFDAIRVMLDLNERAEGLESSRDAVREAQAMVAESQASAEEFGRAS